MAAIETTERRVGERIGTSVPMEEYITRLPGWCDADGGPSKRGATAGRYVPMPPELAAEFKRYPAVLGEDRILPPEPGAKRERQTVDKSFDPSWTWRGSRTSVSTISAIRSRPGT
ncbi:hypothetical protein SBA4_3550026 [Candidatus Sulfopaludibacter sp. SbA4]|nr:hypothetical protein SBA4_3550026 [Candidatus Sulfopaludibacter sp. SbA4]